MNTITAQQIILTSTGPVALIDGTWYSVNGTSTEVFEIRYALRPSEITALGLTAPPAPPAIGQRVYWSNMFGIVNSGRVEFVDDLYVTVRLPDDEDTGTRGGTLTLRRSQVSTSRPSR